MAGESEPLCHELLREAIASMNHAPRSALLLAATAVEIGVKGHIGHIAPPTQWLISKVPSPPIAKILREYLKDLHRESNLIPNWSALSGLWKACQELFEDRNALAHAGTDPAPEVLGTHLDTARDILYLLDALAGRKWAQGLVSANLAAKLNWTQPIEMTRGIIEIRESSPFHELDPMP